MKVLIINTVKDSQNGMLTGTDSAITFELYRKYRNLGITASHMWSKYIFIDEKDEYIGTFSTMDKVIESKGFLGNCLVVTHEQWLDRCNPEWKTTPRYQYW